jgi:hypothetical protein
MTGTAVMVMSVGHRGCRMTRATVSAQHVCIYEGKRQGISITRRMDRITGRMEMRNDEDDESRLGWDELSEAGRQRRAERMVEYADMRRKEMREDEMINSMRDKEGRV